MVRSRWERAGGDMYPYDLSPKFFGVWIEFCSFENFQLSLYFTIKKQVGQNAYFINGSNFGLQNNAPAQIVGNEWKNPGDIASIAKYTIYPNNSLSGNSDLGFTDASLSGCPMWR